MRIFWMLILFTAISTSVLADEKLTSTMPIFSQKIEHNVPEGWKPVFENVNGGVYIIEFVPSGQTKDNWKQMFTVQGFKDAVGKISAKDFLERLGGMYKEMCPERAVFELIDEERISGFNAQGAIIGCGSVDKDQPGGLKKGTSEISYFIAVEGKNDIYIFHKGQRGEEFDLKNPPLTKDNAKNFISSFKPIRLCKGGSKFNECL